MIRIVRCPVARQQSPPPTLSGDLAFTILILVLPALLQTFKPTKSTACMGPPLLIGGIAPFACDLAGTLAEIHVDAMVVDEHILHLEIRLFAVLLPVELYKRVLQAVPSSAVADDFARYDLAEPREN